MASKARFLILLAALLLWTDAAFAQNQRPASPRDKAEGSIDGATISVDYGRPSKRGRVIFGELVPYGKVWRTGANEATTLVTDRDLVIGGTEVPAGTYTLYTLPVQEGPWKLIINKQTGQWGTQYDEAQDLGRVDLKVVSLPESVEQFTISIEPREAGGGILRLVWDTTEATVPFTVKQ